VGKGAQPGKVCGTPAATFVFAFFCGFLAPPFFTVGFFDMMMQKIMFFASSIHLASTRESDAVTG